MSVETVLAAGSVASGLVLAIVAIYKLRPESNKIVVDTALGLVKDINADREELRGEVSEKDMIIVEKELENRDLRLRLERCESERERERLRTQGGGQS